MLTAPSMHVCSLTQLAAQERGCAVMVISSADLQRQPDSKALTTVSVLPCTS